MNSTDSPYTYGPVAQEFFSNIPFRVISAGKIPSLWTCFLIWLRLKSPEKLGYVRTEFPVVFNTDILKPGDRICPKVFTDLPHSSLIIQTFPEKTKEGWEYGVRHLSRDFHAYYPSSLVKEGATFVRVGIPE